jgi:hypothetical protein
VGPKARLDVVERTTLPSPVIESRFSGNYARNLDITLTKLSRLKERKHQKVRTKKEKEEGSSKENEIKTLRKRHGTMLVH